MRVLVIGSGGREHALAWRFTTHDAADVLVSPGNPLMADVAEVRPDIALGDLGGLTELARTEKVDLVVVGPEAALVGGLADRLAKAGIPCFGPTGAAARIEASKSFAREICRSAGVPMALGAAFDHVDAAVEYAALLDGQVVVKADGLAAGKGVAVCGDTHEAERHIREALELDRFGSSGRRVVIEQRLDGVEASVIAICDGRDAVLLPAARDHKRLLDADEGPNTGGMGAYSPVPELDEQALEELLATVIRPVLAELNGRRTPFRGALFAGLMLTTDGPRVLEFNARLGDPETQAILPRVAEPLTPILAAAASGSLVKWMDGRRIVATHPGATVAVTLASAGYPDAPRTGDEIHGIEAARAQGALVFGAAVRAGDDRGGLATGGGRVLSVVGRGSDLESAASLAYAAADEITFDGRQLRTDIGRVRQQVPA